MQIRTIQTDSTTITIKRTVKMGKITTNRTRTFIIMKGEILKIMTIKIINHTTIRTMKNMSNKVTITKTQQIIIQTTIT
jgi:hypothetical protein